MTSQAISVEQYLSELPSDRKEALGKLRDTILKNLPPGFEEQMNYGMVGYVVPHSLYPPGYHCDPKLPLPFAGLASQKNSINFYHTGLYINPSLLEWFLAEYPKHCAARLDMGKSCIRFKTEAHMPLKLIGQLIQKLSVEDYIKMYESGRQKAKGK
jgi:uncharacterized protein YdhG (YjbR/CyaY superfamily)